MERDPLAFRAVVADWNACHGAFFRVRDSDLEWHQREQDWLSYSVRRVRGVALLLAQATDEGRTAGISAKTLWVSLAGAVPRGDEKAFISELDGLAPACGKTRLFLGGDEFHLVPGVPDAPDGGWGDVVSHLKFSTADAVDYAGSLHTEGITDCVAESQARARADGWTLNEVHSESELDELDAFMAKEFAGRWTREFRFWRRRTDTKRAFWSVLRQDHGPIKGFARLALRGSGVGGWCPGALRLPFLPGSGDESTDACLGPIGVAVTERGKGAGKLLLGLSLQILLNKRAERVCIDWTNAYNYYKPLGLSVVRKYRSAWRDY